jgi:hypothetical protein
MSPPSPFSSMSISSILIPFHILTTLSFVYRAQTPHHPSLVIPMAPTPDPTPLSARLHRRCAMPVSRRFTIYHMNCCCSRILGVRRAQ